MDYARAQAIVNSFVVGNYEEDLARAIVALVTEIQLRLDGLEARVDDPWGKAR